MRREEILVLSDTEWAEAKRRADIIDPLSKMGTVGRCSADEAALQLGVSRRHIYELIRRYRTGDGLVTALAPEKSNGGKGKAG
jgi:putative transposase